MNPFVPDDLRAAFDRERKDARAAKGKDAPSARQQTVQMYGRLADLQRDVIARERVSVACARGCSYCCHLRVEIRPHEAFVLAQHVQTKLGSDARERVLAKVNENLARISMLTPEQHIRAGIACALLDGGVCSVYDARPAACRKYYSISLPVCRSAFNDTAAPLTGEIEDEQVRLAGNAVALGYAKGLEEAGYDTTLYELHFALKRALEDAKAEKRYRSGKKAFVG